VNPKFSSNKKNFGGKVKAVKTQRSSKNNNRPSFEIKIMVANQLPMKRFTPRVGLGNMEQIPC